MGGYVLLAVLMFLVFGVPLIDWVYRLRLRREAAKTLG